MNRPEKEQEKPVWMRISKQRTATEQQKYSKPMKKQEKTHTETV